jgi:type II secretory pathway pseudopilin PulG
MQNDSNETRGGSVAPGFSLVEVMVGFVIFGILCMSLTTTAIHSLTVAHQNVMQTTAYATAQSFLEQIKVMPEATLVAALKNPEATTVPTRSIAPNALDVDDPIFLEDPNSAKNGGQNHKSIVVDLRGADQSEPVYLDMWFDLDIKRFSEASGFIITLNFAYEIRGIHYAPRRLGRLSVVRTAEWSEG